jgi:hypothetical protein
VLIPADFQPRLRERMLEIDACASAIGARIARMHACPAELRSEAKGFAARGLCWLAETRAELADALELDVRLAALPMLKGWAIGRGGTWVYDVNIYADLLMEHLHGLAWTVIPATELTKDSQMPTYRITTTIERIHQIEAASEEDACRAALELPEPHDEIVVSRDAVEIDQVE